MQLNSHFGLESIENSCNITYQSDNSHDDKNVSPSSSNVNRNESIDSLVQRLSLQETLKIASKKINLMVCLNYFLHSI